jgi:hypothetical protein
MSCTPDSIEEFNMGFRISRNARAKKSHKSGTSLLSQRPHPPLIYSPSHSMSSFAPDLGDAVRPDGTLKDASEISWSFDADDSIPFPSGDASGDASGGRISSGDGEPAVPTAALHWTTRVIRPAQHFRNGAKSDSSAPTSTPLAIKRKVSCKNPAHCVTQKVTIDVDDEDSKDSNANSDDRGTTTEPVTEPTSDDFEALRAMADADIRVRFPLPLTFNLHPHLLTRL